MATQPAKSVDAATPAAKEVGDQATTQAKAAEQQSQGLIDRAKSLVADQKYPEALTSINRALQAIGANADLGELARGEQKRLLTLTGGSAPIPAPK